MLPWKWENVSRCFFAKIYHLHWISSRANILCKYIIYIFFQFCVWFCGSFSKIFPLTPASCDKKFLKQFLLHCTSICISSKSMLQSFKILFQTEDINIYVLRGVYFSRYVQLTIWLSDENASAMKYEPGFSR